MTRDNKKSGLKLKELFTSENRAVSPVIGVILMVAITVILAAVIGTTVLKLGQDQAGTSQPTASFDFDYDSAAGEVTVTHASGDTIDSGNLNVSVDGTVTQWTGLPITAGDQLTVSGVSDSSTVRVVWKSADGSSSTTLQTWDGPTA